MYMLTKTSIASVLFATSVFGHMQLISPCPRYSPKGENCPAIPSGQSPDYSLSSPLKSGQPLCKYTTPFATPSAVWTAGQSITVKFAEGGAAHSGGHCQFSLSYDGGNKFVVIHEELKNCFFNGPSNTNNAEVRSYTFNLPEGLPSSDKAVFAWTWVNASGNREFYMNCADVAIKGSSGSFTGKEITIANYNEYPKIPAFAGNYDTGLEYYKDAKDITVTGNGSSSGGDSGSGSDYSANLPPIGHTPLEAESADAPVSSALAPSDIKTVPPAFSAGPTDVQSPPAESNATPPPDTGSAVPTVPTGKPTDAPAPSAESSHTPTPSADPTNASEPTAEQPNVDSKPSESNSAYNTSPSEGGSGLCSETVRCSPDGTGIQFCMWGEWSKTHPCNENTKCITSGKVTYCGWKE